MYSQNILYSLPNLPSSVSTFSGPTIFSNQRLQNINCILDPTETQGALYLGDTISVKKVEHLIKNNIQSILSCAPQAIFVHPGDPKLNIVSTKFISAHDNLNYNISQHFEEAYQFIDQNIEKKLNVLVHCHAGVSRSAAIVIAYIMKKKGLSFQSAFELVKSRRNRIRPNERFKTQLKEYQSKITLNYLNGSFTQKDKNSLGKTSNSITDYSSPVINSFPSIEKIVANNERVSEPLIGKSRDKKQYFSSPYEQNVGTYKPSGLSITQLLSKTELDNKYQKQLEFKLNDIASELQKETYSLSSNNYQVRRDRTPPKRSMKNINQGYYNTAPSYKQLTKYDEGYSPYSYTNSYSNSYSSNSYTRPSITNPERNIHYYQSSNDARKRDYLDKQKSQQKSKPALYQGKSDYYKSVVGSMKPPISRYESDNYYDKKYY